MTEQELLDTLKKEAERKCRADQPGAAGELPAGAATIPAALRVELLGAVLEDEEQFTHWDLTPEITQALVLEGFPAGWRGVGVRLDPARSVYHRMLGSVDPGDISALQYALNDVLEMLRLNDQVTIALSAGKLGAAMHAIFAAAGLWTRLDQGGEVHVSAVRKPGLDK